jgi:hypothetical protein
MPAAASLGLPAVAQAAAGPDPIFAAIEAHRKAHAEFGTIHDRECALEEELPHDKHRSGLHPGGEIVETDDPRWIAAIQATHEASHLADEAAAGLAGIEPTTIAGVCALLNYFVEVEAIDGGALWPDNLIDDDEPALEHWSASFGYFVARNVARALARLS